MKRKTERKQELRVCDIVEWRVGLATWGQATVDHPRDPAHRQEVYPVSTSTEAVQLYRQPVGAGYDTQVYLIAAQPATTQAINKNKN